MADTHDRLTRHHAGSVLSIALAHSGANYPVAGWRPLPAQGGASYTTLSI
jgi:hypothetical protein